MSADDDDDDVPESPPASMPGWVMTFADLMSLLMCFFVLLLSFSEMDLKKFKQVAGSMDKAFGVQRVVRANETPRGTSIIAQEFSPGRPEPTPLNEVRQMTTLDTEERLKVDKIKTDKGSDGDERAAQISEKVKDSIREGLIEVEKKESKVVIRILEKGSFNSGSANIKKEFLPTLEKLAEVIADVDGNITIAGYTDNIPIHNDMFRSNWELSAIRAFAVLNELLKHPKLTDDRFILEGHGANEPIASNDTIFTRAKNRRVELIILQTDKKPEEEKKSLFIHDTGYKKPPSLDGISGPDVSPFPAVRRITKTGAEDNKPGDLGIFDENAIYDYELEKSKHQKQSAPPTQLQGETSTPSSTQDNINQLQQLDGIEMPASMPVPRATKKPKAEIKKETPTTPATAPKVEDTSTPQPQSTSAEDSNKKDSN